MKIPNIFKIILLYALAIIMLFSAYYFYVFIFQKLYLLNQSKVESFFRYSIELIMLMIIYFIYKLTSKQLIFKLQKLKDIKVKWKEVLILILVFAIIFIFSYVAPKTPPEEGKYYTEYKNFFAFFTLCIWAPIFEETINRGLFSNICLNKKIIEKKHEKVCMLIAILISATLFTYFHGQTDIVLIISKFAFGVFTMFLYYKYKNLKINIAAHFIWNALTLILGYIT